MGSSVEWDAEKMFQLYVHDYMMKNDMHTTAEIFAKEAHVCNTIPVVIDVPGGFLSEWWSIFHEQYNARPVRHHETGEGSSSMVGTEGTVNPGIYDPVETNLGMSLQSHSQFPLCPDYMRMRNHADGTMATKTYYEDEDEHLGQPRNMNPSLQFFDVDKLKISDASPYCASSSQQEIYSRLQPQSARDASLGMSVPRDPTLYGIPRAMLTGSGLCDTEQGGSLCDACITRSMTAVTTNEVNSVSSLRGWPLTGLDHILQGFGNPVLSSLFQVPNYQKQFQMSSPYQQEALAQLLADQTANIPSHLVPGSSDTTDFAARNLMLLKCDVYGKDQMSRACQEDVFSQDLAKQTANRFSLAGPGSSANIDYDARNIMLHKSHSYAKNYQMMTQMKQTAKHHHQQDRLHKKKFQETQQEIVRPKEQNLRKVCKKRKSLSQSQPGDDTLEDHTPHDAENKPAEENIESFLSHDLVADITRNSFSISQQRSTACGKNEDEDFSFEEIGCFKSSKSKVLCCHFSSNGKLLASAGHDKKVTVRNMDTLDIAYTTQCHRHIVTDVRFRPSSSAFATSSFDKTVRIWDASKSARSILNLLGHADQVMSLDFHPTKLDLLCSCDTTAEIRLWNINDSTCTRVTKGANRKVRFQPQDGKLLAAAAGRGISIIDVETDCIQFYLKGHAKEIRSICWDTSGKYIASVSEDSARMWLVQSGGKCIHELHSSGGKFESCIFHPAYSLLLVIGGYQSLELWNPTESDKTLSIQAHDGIIATLADSPQTEVIASGSHDQSVKLWK